ncbi:MAG: hypothetical protein JWM86_111 [Thermoleophilia bacterium]|nr:hypothetical protein [Thermoleophilia bacterium]
MIRRPLGTDTSDIVEPVSAAPVAAEAGSTSLGEPPSIVADLARAAVCVALVASCVGSPGSAPIVAPFIPVLVALRLLRSPIRAVGFIVATTVASIVVALLAAPGSIDEPGLPLVGALVAALLVPFLGVAHARSALPDSPPAPEALTSQAAAWPEPRILTGQSHAIAAWVVATLVLVAALVPAMSGSRDLLDATRDIVDEAYEPYEQACASGGSLAAQNDLCAQLLDQRRDATELVDDHGLELLAALLAATAWASALTAHLIVSARQRRRFPDAARPGWRLRELEVHWSATYLLVLGLVALMVRSAVTGPADDIALAAGVGLSTLGVLLVLEQGVGLAAWLLARRPVPRWYRVGLVVAALVAASITIVVVFVLGVLDLAAHPRRRALASGSVSGRGSGS